MKPHISQLKQGARRTSAAVTRQNQSITLCIQLCLSHEGMLKDSADQSQATLRMCIRYLNAFSFPDGSFVVSVTLGQVGECPGSTLDSSLVTGSLQQRHQWLNPPCLPANPNQGMFCSTVQTIMFADVKGIPTHAMHVFARMRFPCHVGVTVAWMCFMPVSTDIISLTMFVP